MYDLRPKDHPLGDKHFRFDQFQSYSCGICHRVQIDRGYPGSTSFALLELMGDVFFVSWLLPVTVPVRSPFLYILVRNRKEVHRVLDEFLVLLCSCSQEVPACAADDADVPV